MEMDKPGAAKLQASNRNNFFFIVIKFFTLLKNFCFMDKPTTTNKRTQKFFIVIAYWLRCQIPNPGVSTLAPMST